MSEPDDRPSLRWTLLGTQGAALLAILSFCLVEAGVGFAQLKELTLVAGIAGTVGAILSARNNHNQITLEKRDQALERSIRQSSTGIPWYVAPVLWIPTLMLLVIWYVS